MENDPSALAKLIARWSSSPLKFVYEAIGIGAGKEVEELSAWQIDSLAALETQNRVAIRSGHGVGKTFFNACVVLWFIQTKQDAKVPITAPVSDQIGVNLFGELRKLLRIQRDNGIIGKWLADNTDIKDGEIVFGGTNIAIARTARRDNPEALAGMHATNLLFLIDEASGVEEVVFETAMGALSTPGAYQVLTGNPTRPQGYFYNCFHKNRQQWWTKRVSSEEVPRARGHIQDVINNYGQDSNQYRVRVLGEFPTSSDDQLIRLDLVEAACGREVAPILVKPIWGVDAGYRTDRSSLIKRKGNVLLEEPKYWSGIDTMQLVGKIVLEWETTPVHMRPSDIMVDVIGIGAGVVHRLRELGLPVRGVNVAEGASDNTRFDGKRTELWCKAADWFRAKDCAMPKSDSAVMQQFIAEITAPLLKPPTSSGKERLESKEETKKRLGVSPDLADAFIHTFAAYNVPEGQQSAHSPAVARTTFNPFKA